MKRAIVTASAGVALSLTSAAFAQLRIVSLNGANADGVSGPRNPWMNTILTAIGTELSDDPTIAGNSGITKPIDILCLQEVTSASSTALGYKNLLNTIYPGANYQYGTVDGGSTGSGTQGIV